MFMKSVFLSIDQGGHASRALLFDEEGIVVSEGYEEIKTFCKNDNWVEHDPEELVSSIKKAINRAVAKLDKSQYRIVSAGLATQRSSMVCWNKANGQALSPVISWQDRRAAAWVHKFDQYGKKIHKVTGLFITAHYGVSKFKWCMDNLPAVKQAYSDGQLVWGPLASFIIYRLLEEKPLLADPANASRTLLYNMNTLGWDDDLLALFDVPQETLPDCVPTLFDFGHFYLDEIKIPLKIVTGDQSAALFAYGEPESTAVYINLGTGAFVQRVFNQSVDYVPKLLTSVVSQIKDEITYVLEGTVNGAGSAFVEVENQFGIDPREAQKKLTQWLEQYSDVPLYLNGVSGLGSPYWVADFKSRFTVEGDDTQKIVAVAESILFLIMVNLQEMDKICSPPEYIVVTGGLSQNAALCQRLADLVQKEVYRPEECEATARGTAYLLMNNKSDWSEKEKGLWIRPSENKKFNERFICWKTQMKQEIELLSSGY